MDARAAFLFGYAGITTSVLGGDRLLATLTDDQLRTRPDARVNPIIWPLWHIARCEDATVNRMVADRPQVFDRDDWPSRLGIVRRDMGTFMTDDEVDALRRRIDLDAFRSYRMAVIERTLDVVHSLDPAAWDVPVTAAHAKRVGLEEGMLAHADGMIDRWSTERSKGTWLFSHVINHGQRHLGEAITIRGLLGLAPIV